MSIGYTTPGKRTRFLTGNIGSDCGNSRFEKSVKSPSISAIIEKALSLCILSIILIVCNQNAKLHNKIELRKLYNLFCMIRLHKKTK